MKHQAIKGKKFMRQVFFQRYKLYEVLICLLLIERFVSRKHKVLGYNSLKLLQ